MEIEFSGVKQMIINDHLVIVNKSIATVEEIEELKKYYSSVLTVKNEYELKEICSAFSYNKHDFQYSEIIEIRKDGNPSEF